MKAIQRILFFDRPLLFISCAMILALIISIMTTVYTGNIQKANDSLRTQLTELRSLKTGLLAIKTTVDSKEKKIGLGRPAGVVPAVEQTLKSLGLKANVLRPKEKNRVREYTEENADLEIVNIDLNSIVNLLYKIDNSPAPMKISNAAIKTSFEDPNRFILKMTVSLLGKG